MSNNNLVIEKMLSSARISTFENAYKNYPKFNSALDMYLWNAEVSSAFLLPMHLYEVILRNAVADILSKIHGNNWPWDSGFERSLPGGKRYNHKKDLAKSP